MAEVVVYVFPGGAKIDILVVKIPCISITDVGDAYCQVDFGV